MCKVNPDLDYIVGWLGVIDMKGLKVQLTLRNKEYYYKRGENSKDEKEREEKERKRAK